MNGAELRAAMLADRKAAPTAIEIKGWGKVFIKTLTMSEVDEMNDDRADDTKKRNTAKVVARLICDEDGVCVFDHNKPEDLEFLASMPSHKLTRVLQKHGELIEADEAGN